MKIRKGFVSNSSSSSFIVVLDKPIEQYSYEEFLEDYDLTDTKHAEILFRDLGCAQKHISEIKEGLEDGICIDLDYEIQDLLSYEAVQEVEDKLREIGKQLIKEKLDAEYDIVDNLHCKYKLEYSDDSTFYSEMEHRFMPNFRGTVKTISHH